LNFYQAEVVSLGKHLTKRNIMKKLVFILTLFFVIGLQAETTKDLNKEASIIKTEELTFNEQDPGTRWHCTEVSATRYVDDGNGGFYIITETWVRCAPYAQ